MLKNISDKCVSQKRELKSVWTYLLLRRVLLLKKTYVKFTFHLNFLSKIFVSMIDAGSNKCLLQQQLWIL